MSEFFSRYNLVTKTSGILSSENQLWIKETRFAFKSPMSFLLDQRGNSVSCTHTASCYPRVSGMDQRGGWGRILWELLQVPEVLILLLIKAPLLVCYCFCQKSHRLRIIMINAYCFTTLEVTSRKGCTGLHCSWRCRGTIRSLEAVPAPRLTAPPSIPKASSAASPLFSDLCFVLTSSCSDPRPRCGRNPGPPLALPWARPDSPGSLPSEP